MNRFHLPNLGYGLGLRAKHYPTIQTHYPKEVEWFEVITENFIETDGRPRRVLEDIAAHYPMVMHGVSLSIGSTDPLNLEYLQKLKTLAQWLKPAWISDHLCWTGIHGVNTHDLLPLPYTEETLAHVVARIKQVQDVLGRPLLIENPSSYVSFKDSTMPEWEFIARMSEAADCALLLDVNNVFVSCFNHRLDTKAYIDALPLDRVVQIHLAGHRDLGSHRIDTHDAPVLDDIWAMYRYVISKAGKISTMIEWDEAIPEFPVLLEELNKARQHAEAASMNNTMPSFGEFALSAPDALSSSTQVMGSLQEVILAPTLQDKNLGWIADKPNFAALQQVAIYHHGYHFRLYDVLHDAYPVLRAYLGQDAFSALVQDYITAHTPHHTTMNPYADALPDFVAVRHDAAAAIAQVEHALDRHFDTAETIALQAADVGDEDAFLALNIGLRTASALFAFDVCVFDYIGHVLGASLGDAPVIAQEKEYILVYRRDDVMHRLKLDTEEFAALRMLQTPMQVEAFLDGLDEQTPPQQVQTWFSRWISNGLLANFSV